VRPKFFRHASDTQLCGITKEVKHMSRSPLALVRAVAVAGALALCSGGGVTLPAQADDGTAQLKSDALSLTAPGWVVYAPFSIARGTTGQFIHADCPSAYPVALNGRYAFDGVGQISGVSVSYQGPRVDVPSDLKEWGWTFYFAKGAPAGTSVILSLFCTRLSVTEGKVVTFLTSGTTWRVPSDWNPSNNEIDAIGGGGGGGSASANFAGFEGGGGGGGAYAAIRNLDFAGGTLLRISIGSGGSGGDAGANGSPGGATYVCPNVRPCNASTALVLASGGGGGGVNGGTGVGGAATSRPNTTSFPGGNGGPDDGGGGSGGGGAAGPLGSGAAGGPGYNGGGGGGGGGNGGGGNGGGSSGSNPHSMGGNGGNNQAGTGGGLGGNCSETGAANGSAGGGGGGGCSCSNYSANGGNGGNGNEWTASFGSGGGGGGDGECGAYNSGGNGGSYGGGGGGGNGGSPAGNGAGGLIVITYTPSGTSDAAARRFPATVKSPLSR
jgi:hypothetical protein